MGVKRKILNCILCGCLGERDKKMAPSSDQNSIHSQFSDCSFFPDYFPSTPNSQNDFYSDDSDSDSDAPSALTKIRVTATIHPPPKQVAGDNDVINVGAGDGDQVTRDKLTKSVHFAAKHTIFHFWYDSDDWNIGVQPPPKHGNSDVINVEAGGGDQVVGNKLTKRAAEKKPLIEDQKSFIQRQLARLLAIKNEVERQEAAWKVRDEQEEAKKELREKAEAERRTAREIAKLSTAIVDDAIKKSVEVVKATRSVACEIVVASVNRALAMVQAARVQNITPLTTEVAVTPKIACDEIAAWMPAVEDIPRIAAEIVSAANIPLTYVSKMLHMRWHNVLCYTIISLLQRWFVLMAACSIFLMFNVVVLVLFMYNFVRKRYWCLFNVLMLTQL